MIFLMLFHLLVCILLVLIILIQPSKGEGLTETLGGAAAQTILGARAGTWLSKATAVFATLFILSCLLISWLSTERTKSIVRNVPVKEEKVKEAEKIKEEPQKPVEGKVEEKPAESTPEDKPVAEPTPEDKPVVE